MILMKLLQRIRTKGRNLNMTGTKEYVAIYYIGLIKKKNYNNAIYLQNKICNKASEPVPGHIQQLYSST
jgi:hypothetical protein